MIYAETEIKLKTGVPPSYAMRALKMPSKRLNTCAPFRANLRFYCVSRMR